MKFEGEHLLPGQLGHFFVILAFVSSIIATISFFNASRLNSRRLEPGAIQPPDHWLRLARVSFFIQVISVLLIFSIIFFICFNHYYEYMYAYKHASKELEYKYLLACIWEGQEGSFLLWTIWHSVLGIFIMARSKEWEAPVMTVISFAQFFLLLMILGIYFFDVRIGNSPFTLTRNEIAAPIFSQPNYLSFIKDGMGLNILLRNYWMVIHPPVLFLGFASTIVPFAYAYAGIQTKRYGDWVKPVLPFALFSACILGVGIMMGGKWAYESLSFGGYWAWDPVENASLVPWLILIAGLHTMVIYKATGHSLRASYLFAILTFVFILYSTFLTRTGILGDTSVHAFTEAGKAINIMIITFVLSFTVPMLLLFFIHKKNIPAIQKEEQTSSREFWMFIGSLVFFLTALFIIAKTSVPVYNKVFGTRIAAPEEAEFSYNKVVVLVAIIIGLLTAVSQYLKYKSTPASYIIKKIAIPTLAALIITALLALFYPMNFYKHGTGFLGAIYVALFATIYSFFANAFYIWTGLKGSLKNAGASVAHAGFALMLVGILISGSNKEVISSSMVNGINLPAGKDPMTKQDDDPKENLTLLRQVPTRMANYDVTYLKDSAGHEKGRKFYELQFESRDPVTKKITEKFTLLPDVYLMKDNNMSSNPDTKSYLTKDVFTYISYALSDQKKPDTTSFNPFELAEGDTSFFSNGYLILNKVVKNPVNERYHFKPTDVALMADVTIVSKDSMHYKAMPLVQVDEIGINHIDDTLYAQDLIVRFVGVDSNKKIRLGVKETDKMIDFVTVKSYVFPYINFVWLGLIIMATGLLMSMIKRAGFTTLQAALTLVVLVSALFYMFLLAN
ncbi:MAG: cytochrome c biogenesis protein CcsA [Ferruginibacter sp.]